eukprot:TRINITY_DN325_c1_g2_i1.p1 TRINITY_DN325_c1_g2~~TRINITY_DN325_c1_g2_i1.p1  ORF type:complete len:558 (+),score=72.86 TRINITY_DN325_c1_g2_i1:147-1820(+)
MAEYSSKRAVGGLGSSRGGSGIGIRDKKHEDRSIQHCNRIGCSTRLHSMKETQVSNQERAKYSRPSFCPTSSKVGSTSKPFSGASGHRKSCPKHQNPKSVKETFLAENSSRQGETQASELTPAIAGIYASHPESKDADSAVLNGSSMNTIEEVVRYTVGSNSRSQEQIHQRSRLGKHNTSSISSAQRSFPPRNTNHTVKPALQGQGAIAQRYSLKNQSCTLISDVRPSSSSSDSDRDRRADGRKKRYPNGESSSRGKSLSGPSTAVKSGMQRNVICSPIPSFPDHQLPQQATRRTRNSVAIRDGVPSVRTQKVINGDTRTRLSNDNNDNHISFHEPVVISQSPQTEFLISESVRVSSSESFSRELPSVCLNTYGQTGSNHETARSRPIAHLEDSNNRPFHSLFLDQDVYRRFEEVVLALERIGQDDDLAYEQLLDLESNLLLGFHDQHRAMRLDIDNMSYEELLALEEKMGTVSTALTEEALSNCLKRSCYTSLPLVFGSPSCGDDDTKCIICQEEYVLGDEVGKLGCKHRYHVLCIHQWLRLKNWCPICKSPVLAS